MQSALQFLHFGGLPSPKCQVNMCVMSNNNVLNIAKSKHVQSHTYQLRKKYASIDNAIYDVPTVK